jgi:hypothetical protein
MMRMLEAFMPAFEISQSMLVNQGLSARVAAGVAMPEIGEVAEPALADIVGSFKKFVGDDTVCARQGRVVQMSIGA